MIKPKRIGEEYMTGRLSLPFKGDDVIARSVTSFPTEETSAMHGRP
jgi:hypothetical protein